MTVAAGNLHRARRRLDPPGLGVRKPLLEVADVGGPGCPHVPDEGSHRREGVVGVGLQATGTHEFHAVGVSEFPSGRRLRLRWATCLLAKS